MTVDRYLAAIGLCALLALPGIAAPQSAEARTDVPIDQTVLPDGDTRYSVPITVGGSAPIRAALDTGSFGLRVLKAALTPDRYEPTDIRRQYGFGGGARFDGVLARATLGVGSAQTDRPILFQLIDTVGCVEAQPDCPASRLRPEDYRIAGDGYAGRGFNAILGLSMRRATTDDSALNPLTVTGDRSWIVILPRPGSTEPGRLIIDPTDADRAGFVLLQLQPEGGASDGRQSGWADTALPGCLVDLARKERSCGRTVLDSGAPGFSLPSAKVGKPTPWGPGRKASFELDVGGTRMVMPFTTGRDWSKRVVAHPPRRSAGAEITAGTLPYFSYAVLYDAEAGTIGLKRRD